MNDGRRHWLRENAVPIGLAVALHVVVGLLIVIAAGSAGVRSHDMPGRSTQHVPIQAVVVKQSDYEKAQAQIEQAQQAKTEQAEKLQRQAQEARVAKKKAQEQLARLKQQQEQAQKEAAAKAAAQQKKVERLKAQAAAAKKQREAQEAAAKKAQAQAEQAKKARAAEEARIAKEKAEAKKRAEAKARAAAEARKKAAAEAEAKRKAQMKAEMAAEAKEMSQHALGNWIAAVTAKVEQNWNRPLTAPPGLDCIIQITQLPTGEVLSAKMLSCNGDSAVEQSILTAIYKSSPLPTPADPNAFRRQFKFEFIPGQSH